MISFIDPLLSRFTAKASLFYQIISVCTLVENKDDWKTINIADIAGKGRFGIHTLHISNTKFLTEKFTEIFGF